MSWTQTPLPEHFVKAWDAMNAPVPAPRAYRHRRGLTAMVGREPLGPGPGEDLRWHISLRYGDPGVNGRVPTWEEIIDAAHQLRPGVAFVVGVPPRSWWINVHPDVLHLWETYDRALVAQWQAERRGDRPT